MPQMPPNAAPPGGNATSPEDSAQKVIEMIKTGFDALGKMLQAAGPNLDPQDIKLYHAALQATDLLIQTLTAPPSQEGAATPKQPNQPMPMNAKAGAPQAP